MTIEHFTKMHLRPSPWKNGRGLTREIVAFPPGSDMESFSWRVTIAEISRSGAFSLFPGIDRQIVLLDGEGALLQSDNGDVIHRLDTLFAPFVFAGETPLTASLLGAASVDFNVMTRRVTASAEVHVARECEVQPSASAGVLFAARGDWLVQSVTPGPLENSNSPVRQIDEGTGVWWADESLAWRVQPDTGTGTVPALLAVQIKPQRNTRESLAVDSGSG